MEKDILSLFAHHKNLTFAQIGKSLNIRSNKLAYHLNLLCHNEKIVKKGINYSLSDVSTSMIPYFSPISSPLPIVLVHLGTSTHAFLHIRKKHPYFGYYGLPGGRLRVGESIEQAAQRIMKDKFGVTIKAHKQVSIALEHVITKRYLANDKHKIMNLKSQNKKATPLYSFLLILVHATAKEKIPLINIAAKKKGIIPSDYAMLTTSQKRVRIPVICSRTKS